MHCFSGDAEFATECVRRGYYLSFAGTVTFANAVNLREAAALTPLEQIMVETDAPFLTPVPHRGRPNASYLIPVTVRALAATAAMTWTPSAPRSRPTANVSSARLKRAGGCRARGATITRP